MRSERFELILNVLPNGTVNLTPELYNRISTLDRLLKEGQVSYEEIDSSEEYYAIFRNKIIAATQLLVKELRLVVAESKKCGCSIIGALDLNKLDTLDGAIKSAVQNKVVSWNSLGLEDKTEFEELIKDAEETLRFNLYYEMRNINRISMISDIKIADEINKIDKANIPVPITGNEIETTLTPAEKTEKLLSTPATADFTEEELNRYKKLTDEQEEISNLEELVDNDDTMSKNELRQLKNHEVGKFCKCHK